MRIALFPNLAKASALPSAAIVQDYLSKHGVEVLCEDEKAAHLGLPKVSSVNPAQIDYLISLGGDGTILSILHNYPNLEAPILGINLGGLGFMAEIPVTEIERALECLINGNFMIHERMVIEGKLSSDRQCFAVNEIVIHRAKIPSLIDLSINAGGCYVNAFSSDGLILSTPTGSTAYNLAAGGPILTPDLNALVITPICPHTISYRPLVLDPNQKIEVTYQSDLPPAEIAYDGMPLHTIRSGETLEITLSKKVFRLISLGANELFFSALRSKLNWTGRLKT
jgi:NAD+ kinase